MLEKHSHKQDSDQIHRKTILEESLQAHVESKRIFQWFLLQDFNHTEEAKIQFKQSIDSYQTILKKLHEAEVLLALSPKQKLSLEQASKWIDAILLERFLPVKDILQLNARLIALKEYQRFLEKQQILLYQCIEKWIPCPINLPFQV